MDAAGESSLYDGCMVDIPPVSVVFAIHGILSRRFWRKFYYAAQPAGHFEK
jgi:hypothetical protein